MVAEGNETVPWTKPEELSYSANDPLPKLGGQFNGDFNVLLCDSWCQMISGTVPEPALRAAITISDGLNIGYKPIAEGTMTIELPDSTPASRK